MSTKKSLFKNFLKTAQCAFISGIMLLAIMAQAQFRPPTDNDSRPSEPAPPAASPAKPSDPKPPKPSATPAVKPTTGAATTTGTKPKPTPVPTSFETSRKFPKVVTKLMVDELQNGRGRVSKPGSQLVVHFQSWLYDPTQPLGRGPQFESTVGKSPYKFTLQNPETPHIKGWEEGLVDMKVGAKRRLIIPPDLAYGANGAGQVIPPGATLLYEIELVDIE